MFSTKRQNLKRRIHLCRDQEVEGSSPFIQTSAIKCLRMSRCLIFLSLSIASICSWQNKFSASLPRGGGIMVVFVAAATLALTTFLQLFYSHKAIREEASLRAERHRRATISPCCLSTIWVKRQNPPEWAGGRTCRSSSTWPRSYSSRTHSVPAHCGRARTSRAKHRQSRTAAGCCRPHRSPRCA